MRLLVGIGFFIGGLWLTGCSTEIDLYGESRLERPEPIQAREEARSSPHRNRKQAKPKPPPEPESKTDYGAAEGVFLIVPPAIVNPKNLEEAPDPQIITIDFQSGFEGLYTVVSAYDEIIYEGRLTTKLDGFAGTTSFHYAESPARFTLAFPLKGLRETFTVDPEVGRFLGISLKSGQLVLDLQEKPFFYGEGD